MTKNSKKEVSVKKEGEAAPRGRDMFDLLRSEIDRLFDDFSTPALSWPRGLARRSAMTMSGLASLPPMDFVERDGQFELSVEMPGFDASEIDIRLSDGRLTVKGAKAEESEDKEGDYVVHERSSGSVERSITLPRSIDAAKVEARLQNGVLTIVLPKTEEAREQERHVEVRAA